MYLQELYLHVSTGIVKCVYYTEKSWSSVEIFKKYRKSYKSRKGGISELRMFFEL